ncbi:MAG: hypothetical protein CVT70_11555 [Alphaproteobacteria bacterium HGW-Alphaproteobacteria-1]|jgi:hypothetical protein|nr:MAG: hypothetical protein CVT70_11555 [Alphaproteobacteria bacterium HGW-Alphaproteobacteria-1]
MQQALIPTVGLLCRLWLAIFFMAHVSSYLAPKTGGVLFGFSGHSVLTGAEVLDMGVAGLLALIALWLMLGIYSRVMAVLGIVICTATAALFQEPVFTLERNVAFLSVAILAVTGGGRLRLHAGGWRLRDML